MSHEKSVLFRMHGAARAETVAKQMKKVLAEIGRRPKLGFCREAVARMYGHADWRALAAAKFDDLSPDDAAVSEEERKLRHDQQREVLVKMGLAPEAAEALRVRLSPTGRSVADTENRLPVAIQQTIQYHPDRFLEALDASARLKFEMAQPAGGARPHGHAGDRGPDYSLAILVAEVARWARRSSILPLDGKALEVETLEGIHQLANNVREGEGTLLDVSSVARELAKRDVSGDVYSGAFDTRPAAGMPPVYVHFGTNAFPSPWPGCGIEGCYVDIMAFGEWDPRAIRFFFVASPELSTAPRLGIGEDLFGVMNHYDLLFSMRFMAASVYADGNFDDPVSLGDLKTDEPDLNGYDAAWKPFLQAPLNAAWNAVRAMREGSCELTDGMLSDLPKSLFRKLARARTEDRRNEVVAEIADEGEMVVRYMGGVPLVAMGESDPALPPEGPYPPVGDIAAWAAGYFELASEAEYPEVQLDMARKALGVLEQVRDGESVEFDLDLYKAWAALIEQEAYSDLHLWSEALAAGRRCLELDERDGNGMRFRMATLLVRNDDAKGAAELLARFDRDNGSGALEDWSRALLHAKFGTDDQARASLSKAVAEGTGVRELLLGGDGFRERWYDREMVMAAHEDGSGEAYVVAGVHRDGWDAVPPHRSGGFGTKKPRRYAA